MGKRVLAALLALMCLLPASAKGVFLKDVGFSFGHGDFMFDQYSEPGIGVLLGGTFGLTERAELDIVAVAPLAPRPFSDVTIGLEAGFSLLGERVFSYDNAGLGINTLLSVGLYANNHNDAGLFLPTILTLRVAPLTVGSPRIGKRERVLPLGVAWNILSGQVSFFFSAFVYDFYDKRRVAAP